MRKRGAERQQMDGCSCGDDGGEGKEVEGMRRRGNFEMGGVWLMLGGFDDSQECPELCSGCSQTCAGMIVAFVVLVTTVSSSGVGADRMRLKLTATATATVVLTLHHKF